jgi:hypothetical protein
LRLFCISCRGEQGAGEDGEEGEVDADADVDVDEGQEEEVEELKQGQAVHD